MATLGIVISAKGGLRPPQTRRSRVPRPTWMSLPHVDTARLILGLIMDTLHSLHAYQVAFPSLPLQSVSLSNFILSFDHREGGVWPDTGGLRWLKFQVDNVYCWGHWFWSRALSSWGECGCYFLHVSLSLHLWWERVINLSKSEVIKYAFNAIK